MMLRQMGVSFFETDRGGDITYHGPGQLVGYPILNLAEIRRDVAWYVRSLEEAMIRATAEFGIRTSAWPDARACGSMFPRMPPRPKTRKPGSLREKRRGKTRRDRRAP